MGQGLCVPWGVWGQSGAVCGAGCGVSQGWCSAGAVCGVSQGWCGVVVGLWGCWGRGRCVCGIRVGCVEGVWAVSGACVRGIWCCGRLYVGSLEGAVIQSVMDICYFIGKRGRSSVSPQHTL